jgi:membrane protease YdiL (CAAX protease family)
MDRMPLNGELAHAHRTERWRMAVLLFAMIFPTLSAWLYFVILAPPSDSTPPGFLPLTTYAAGKVIQFGLPIVWLLAFERSRILLSKPRATGTGVAIGFGLLVALGMFALYFAALRGSPLLSETPAKITAKLVLFHAATPVRYLLLAVFISVIHSFLEEYYWRWFVYGQLRKTVALGPGLVFSSLGFMGHHVIILAVFFPGRFFSLAVPFSLGIAIGGAVWAWIYERDRNLLAPWLSHLIVDAAIFAMGYSMVFA